MSYFDLLLATGLRPSEGLALKWKDIDPAKRTLGVVRTLESVNGKMYFKEVKTKRSRRIIDLHDGTISFLLENKGPDASPDDLIFVSEVGGPVDVSKVCGRYYRP